MVGRPPKSDRPVRKIFSIPTSIMSEFELVCTDPLTGKQILGMGSEVVSALIDSFLQALATNKLDESMQRPMAVARKYLNK